MKSNMGIMDKQQVASTKVADRLCSSAKVDGNMSETIHDFESWLNNLTATMSSSL